MACTNGCFDLLHEGHYRYLYQVSQLADLMVVGLNSDRSVCNLKGPGRPFHPQQARALALASLGFIDLVAVFDSVRAVEFINFFRPDFYAKGGDYSLETLDPGERAALQGMGTKISFVPLVPGNSTTSLAKKLGLT